MRHVSNVPASEARRRHEPAGRGRPLSRVSLPAVAQGSVRFPAESRAVQPSHYWTWRLLSAGFSAAQCEAIRGLGRETILDHALRALEEGWPVRAEACLSAELLAALRQHVGPDDPPEVRAVLTRLPPGTRYEEVVLFLKCRQQAAADGA